MHEFRNESYEKRVIRDFAAFNFKYNIARGSTESQIANLINS